MQPEVIFNSKKDLKKINLNDFIDRNSDFLKNEFLSIIENTREKKIFNKRLKDFFQLNKFVNLWDLSHFNEKNIFKEDYINSCLQYLAIVKIIQNYNIKEFSLNNVDKKILNILKKYNKNINFKILKKKKKNLKDDLKIFILGNWFISLIYFLKNNISFHKKQNKVNYDNKNLIISYFCHYEKNFEKNAFFVSDHWKGLEKHIKKKFFYLNFFIPSKKYKSYQSLKKNINNKIVNIKDKNFLNNYFYLNDLIKIISYSFIYSWKFYFLYLILKNKKDSKIALLELSYKIQKRSFSGITCFDNLKNYYTLKKFFGLNPNIRKCIYLMENQSWEKILLKFCNTKNIISYGYVHATMPFWHLNYYQTKVLNKKNIYLPDKIFTVSRINLDLLTKQGISRNKIELVEALRYEWLNKIKKKIFSSNSNKILVFGDYDKKLNDKLFRLIKNFLVKKKNLYIYFKPHPGDITNYNNRNNKLKIIQDLPKKLKFKFYIFSNSTSASAEYTHLSNNIAVFRPKLGINLSPFKDLKEYQNIFFSNEFELLDIINSKKNKNYKNFFYINKNLICWKKKI